MDFNPFKIHYNWLKRIIIFTFFCKIVCKTSNISALLTAYSQSKPTQITPHFSPICIFFPNPLPSPLCPNPCLLQFMSNPPPPLQFTPAQFVYHWTGTGEGSYSVVPAPILPRPRSVNGGMGGGKLRWW